MRYHIAIPKCASNSYLEYVKYKFYNVVEPDFHKELGFFWSNLLLPSYNTIFYAKHLPFIQDTKYDFTVILRNPVERVWSHFQYYIKIRSHALSDLLQKIFQYLQSDIERYELLEYFITHPYTNELRNLQTRFVLGEKLENINKFYSEQVINYRRSKNLSISTKIEDLNFTVQNNLKKIDKVMLLEDLDLIPRKNVNHKKEIMIKKERQLIESYNQVDIKLYNYAKELIRIEQE